MKVKPVIKRNNPDVNTESSDKKINVAVSYDTCLRCVCKSIEDIIKVNDIIHKFNHTQVDMKKHALIQVGRQHRDGVTVIYITVMATDDNIEEDFEKYNDFLYNELSSAKIEFQFVNFENISKNVADIASYTEDNDSKMLVIDRNTINNDEVFDIMCKYILTGADCQYIRAIRIPYNEIVVTTDCKWKMADNYNKENIKESKTEEAEGNTSKNVQVNISIFDKRNSILFDVLVKKTNCIKKVIADYAEKNDDNFFRTVHMIIENNTNGLLFCKIASNFGIVTFPDNK